MIVSNAELMSAWLLILSNNKGADSMLSRVMAYVSNKCASKSVVNSYAVATGVGAMIAVLGNNSMFYCLLACNMLMFILRGIGRIAK